MKDHLQNSRLDAVDVQLTSWMARHGILLLRVSLGIVFFWFGFLKFFPGVSPAEGLASETVAQISGGLVGPDISMPILAVWECLIGVGLMTGRAIRFTILLLFLQMPGTVLPLLLFPELTFKTVPFVLTLEGQYIIKNIVLVCAGLVIGATVRGGRLTAGVKAN
jgi:uncharacterized membrane protein YkgB